MVLLGVLALESADGGSGRRRRWRDRRIGAIRRGYAFGSQLYEPLVLDGAGSGDHHIRGRVVAGVKTGDLLDRRIGDHRRQPDDRPPERMPGEHRLT